MDHKRYYINISGLIFSITSDNELEITENVIPFLIDFSESADCLSTIIQSDDMQYPKGNLVGSDYDSDVYRNFDGNILRFYRRDSKDYYAVTRFVKPESESVVEYLDGIKPQNLNHCFHLTGWEQMLMYHDRMILHASCINTEYGGILFTGISGIGKSTQADLWVKCRDAKLINGDRTIINKSDVWKGYGSPFAGSSRCYVNESVQIRAIVVLNQGEENKIRRLSMKEAFTQIYSGLTVYTWDQVYVEKAFDWAMKLISEMPVYELTCTPDERAVIELESVLRGDENRYE